MWKKDRKMKQVSIIIVTYNSEKDIYDCIDSIKRFSDIPLHDIELIIVDNNSDNTDVMFENEQYKFDAIIHIAGQSSGEVSFENPVYDLQTNAQSTLMLLNYATLRNYRF